ncbi:hypothetical protein BDR04DRAFT_1149074 [Suillus decipiens]|nr:hypothetical protein BDR04DRAFT_1149074 [Suillus decipiens]
MTLKHRIKNSANVTSALRPTTVSPVFQSNVTISTPGDFSSFNSNIINVDEVLASMATGNFSVKLLVKCNKSFKYEKGISDFAIFFSRRNGSGWHLTLAATRPLKVLYFDGSGAAKLFEGTMDTQDIIAWGEPRPERSFDESDRINDLCIWGKEFRINGFVRMEMSFEIMLCDFTAGVEVVSFVHLTLPRDHRSIPPPTSLDHYTWIHTFEVMHSGSWHNRCPGDSRIVLDLTGPVSLYDVALAPSLVPVRAGLERWHHRAFGISTEDISQIKRKLSEVTSRPDPGSGIDWKTLTHVIIDRYADRLELIQYLLSFTSSDSQELVQRAKLAQTQLRVMLAPYLLDATVVPSADTLGTQPSQWASLIFKSCATTHTTAVINKHP